MLRRHALLPASVLALILALPGTAAAGTGPRLQRPDPPAPTLQQRLPAGPGAAVQRNAEGDLTAVLPRVGRPVQVATARGRDAVGTADAFATTYARAFGVTGDSELHRGAVTPTAAGQAVVRYQQQVDGLPVLGGQLVVSARKSGEVLGAVAETVPDAELPAARVSAAAAAARAVRASAAAYGLPVSALTASAPALVAFDPAVLHAPVAGGIRPVWQVEVRAAQRGVAVRDLVLVDALTRAVTWRLDQVDRAGLSRIVCDQGNQPETDDFGGPCAERWLPATVSEQAQQPAASSDATDAYVNTGRTSDFWATLGVDLTELIGTDYSDGWGKALRSTVNYCPESGAGDCPLTNAFWDGYQMYYGSGFPRALDVVGHELAHGVTQQTSGLFYWYQSGAINESLSDIFGELVDLAQPDSYEPGDWPIGEDLPVAGLRSLGNPASQGQPVTVGGPNWAGVDQDNYGVHTNSGVGNHAAWLIANGDGAGPGLGTQKLAWLYWQVEQLLTPGADYPQLAGALTTACSSLVAAGMAGFAAGDCAIVDRAIAATQMTATPDDKVVLSTPQGPSVTTAVTSSTVQASWKPGADLGTPGAQLIAYQVSLQDSSGRDLVRRELPASVTDTEFTGLAPGVRYRLSIAAANESLPRYGTPTVVAVTTAGLARTILSLRASVTTVAYASRTQIYGQLRGSGSTCPTGEQRVSIGYYPTGSHVARYLGAAYTSSTGWFALSLVPPASGTYIARAYSGQPACATSNQLAVAVRAKSRISAWPSTRTTYRYRTLAVSGAVAPNQRYEQVRLEEYVGGRWLLRATAKLSSSSTYRISMRPTTRGYHSYRVRKLTDAQRYDTVSATLKVYVR